MEQNKQQTGDGRDNLGYAAKQMANAAKQAGQKGTEAVASTAAATVKGGAQAGKAAAEIAAGTAAGGPWGAAISAAWSLRHTLFKILICICLFFVFLVVLIVSLPSIIMDEIVGLNGMEQTAEATIASAYVGLSEEVSSYLDVGYAKALADVEALITDGSYDMETSKNSMINYAQSSFGYDVAYILAAYSASMNQQGTDLEDMLSKLDSVTEKMYPVTSIEKKNEVITPVTYMTYQPITKTVVTKVVRTGSINGVTQYRYETETKTYYVPDEERTSDVELEVPVYQSEKVKLPVLKNGKITGTTEATYYVTSGTKKIAPKKEVITYLECTIHPFDNAVIADAFGIDMDAQYNEFNTTYENAINSMAMSLKYTLFGNNMHGQAVPLTNTEMLTFLNQQTCSEERKKLVETGLSLVGKVPYFWGGKSGPGWNNEWNILKLVTAEGSATTGTMRPFGLDCSGFTSWAYQTALSHTIQDGSFNQYKNAEKITWDALLPGDLGFLLNEDGNSCSHVLMFAGYDDEGNRMWVHSTGGEGVVFNTPSYETDLKLGRILK